MRRAIRLGDGTCLAVPPMHPRTPREVRLEVYRAVLRRQYSYAATIADIERELIVRQAAKNRAFAVPKSLAA